VGGCVCPFVHNSHFEGSNEIWFNILPPNALDYTQNLGLSHRFKSPVGIPPFPFVWSHVTAPQILSGV